MTFYWLQFSRSFRYLLMAFITQFSSAFVLWNHTSDTPDLLNRYSNRYGLVVLVSLGVVLLWGLLLFAHRYVEALVMRLAMRWYLVATAIITLAMLALWVSSVESTIKIYFATQYLIVVILFSMLRHDFPIGSSRWHITLVVITVLMLLPMFITTLAERRFKPDEAMWADYASSSFTVGGIFSRTWLQEPYRIMPGLGWSVAGYGWALNHIGFDIHVGRVWNFVSWLLAFGGIAALTWRLYGRNAALLSTLFAMLSLIFIPVWDYRPDHQLAFASTLVFFTAVQARKAKRYDYLWHLACGLLATLAMQLHAAAIVFATGCALYYALELLTNLYRNRNLGALQPVVGFGLGALVGVLIYYVFNIEPVGGVNVFLDSLTGRGYLPNRLRSLTWVSLPEALFIFAAFVYLFRRRNAEDRLFLGLLAALIICAVIFDSQGYFTHHTALYVVPVGVLIVAGLNSFNHTGQHGFRSVLISWVLVAVLIGQMSGLFILWPDVNNFLRTGQLPRFLYQEMKPIVSSYINADDVLVSSHEMIWTLPKHQQLISYAAEQTAMKRWNLSDPLYVWERVRPTVIIYIEGEMHFNEGLQMYVEKYGFQICQTLHVMDRKIQIYRMTCN